VGQVVIGGGRWRRRFELEDAGASRNRPMEGLRGFSIALVFLVHYSLALAPWVPVDSTTFRVMRAASGIGNAGVDLFFLLSGYLIYGTLMRRRQPLGRYVMRRARRIYPTFLVVLFVYVALSLIAPAFSKLPAGRTAQLLTLLENVLLLPGIVQTAPVVGVAWSLSYEMFFYLSLPVIIGALTLRTRSRAYRASAFAVVFALIVANALLFHGLHVRLIMFVAGILLHETIDSGLLGARHMRFADRVAPLLVAACFFAVWRLREARTGPGLLAALAGADPHSEILEAVALFVAFFSLTLAALGGTGVIARLFAVTPLRLLGNISYSYYLVHNLTLRVLFTGAAVVHHPNGREPAMFWVSLPFAFVITLVPAALLFLLVERPLSLSRPASAVQLPTAAPSRTSRSDQLAKTTS
jgi:exopolysaccharide production protein ExoZ